MEDQEEKQNLNSEINDINKHVKISFEDVIGEVSGAKNIKILWKFIRFCYIFGLKVIYTLLTIFVAPLLALFFGISFAFIAFIHIWVITPALKTIIMFFEPSRIFIRSFLRMIVSPIIEAFSIYWRNIRIQFHNISGPPKNEDMHIV